MTEPSAARWSYSCTRPSTSTKMIQLWEGQATYRYGSRAERELIYKLLAQAYSSEQNSELESLRALARVAQAFVDGEATLSRLNDAVVSALSSADAEAAREEGDPEDA
jgi:hypothetical protein